MIEILFLIYIFLLYDWLQNKFNERIREHQKDKLPKSHLVNLFNSTDLTRYLINYPFNTFKMITLYTKRCSTQELFRKKNKNKNRNLKKNGEIWGLINSSCFGKRIGSRTFQLVLIHENTWVDFIHIE